MGAGYGYDIPGSGGGVAVTIGGNTAGVGALISSGTMFLAGGNNITLSQNGQSITISGAAGGAGGSFSAGVSTIGNTSGSTGTVSNQIVFAGGNNITLSQSTAAGGATVTISGPNTVAQSTQPAVNALGVSNVGSTLGNTGTSSGITFVVAANTTGGGGGNPMVASQSTVGGGPNTIWIVGPAYNTGVPLDVTSAAVSGVSTGVYALADHQHGGVRRVGVSTMGNTAGDTGGFLAPLVALVGSNNITLSQATAANRQITITILDPAMFSAGISTQGNTAGTTGFNSVLLQLVGSNGITLSQSTAAGGHTITISGPTQSNQPAVNALGVSNTGTTLGNTGTSSGITWVFAGSGNITASESTAGGGPNTIWYSVPAQTNQSAIKGLGVSNTGNTAGNTGVSTGIDWVIAGTNNITVSESTVGGGPNTIWISAPNAGGAGQFSLGASNLGNTAGATGITGTRVVLVGTNAISLSQTTDANGATISIDNHQFKAGVSTFGHTAGSTGVTNDQLALVGTNGLTLSQSTDADGGTVTFTPPTIDMWYPMGGGSFNVSQIAQNTVAVQRHVLPVFLTGSVVHVGASMSVSSSSNSSYSGNITFRFGVYTRNVSTLSLLTSNSVNHTFSMSSNNNSISYSGNKILTIPINLSLAPGVYWFALLSSTNSANANWMTISNIGQSKYSANVSGKFNSGTNVTNYFELGEGRYATSTAALPGAIGFTDIEARSAGSRFLPWFGILNFSI